MYYVAVNESPTALPPQQSAAESEPLIRMSAEAQDKGKLIFIEDTTSGGHPGIYYKQTSTNPTTGEPMVSEFASFAVGNYQYAITVNADSQESIDDRFISSFEITRTE
jgi:hypothetical protein